MSTLLVAIPVWSGDYEQVLRNLREQFERDGKCRHNAFVFSDISEVGHHRVVTEAEKCFASVHHTRFTLPRSGEPWPAPQNYVWQFIARTFEFRSPDANGGWFMWESDALPLKAHWLDTLADAYVKGLKPFMGHIVPNLGHMNAVAVYPFNVSDFCTRAMLVKQAPFDVVLSGEVGLKNITPANHLIAHHLKAHGGDPANPITKSIRDALPESTVIIHGYYEPTTEQRKQFTHSLQAQAMNETSKAMRRRRCEEAAGGFRWSDVFKGKGLDVGAGGDPVQLPDCKPFDMLDGDANNLVAYIKKGSLDYLHASQSLEHMLSPRAALLNWALCVKKGGYLVVSVPDYDLYEKRQWPSRFNSDHKSAWSTWRKASGAVPLVNVPVFCREMREHGLECVKTELVDTHFNYESPDTEDQTLPSDGAECFIEMVFRKL